MISVRVNGEERSLSSACTLLAAMAEWGYQGEAFAVAINETFVPRSTYAQTQVQAGDSIEVVSPLEGG
jgi:sulfur carrier protein